MTFFKKRTLFVLQIQDGRRFVSIQKYCNYLAKQANVNIENVIYL